MFQDIYSADLGSELGHPNQSPSIEASLEVALIFYIAMISPYFGILFNEAIIIKHCLLNILMNKRNIKLTTC